MAGAIVVGSMMAGVGLYVTEMFEDSFQILGRPPDSKPGSITAEDMYVVWAGKSTVVMTATKCVNATAG